MAVPKMSKPAAGRRTVKYNEGNAYVEMIRQDLYDRKQLAATTSQTVLFFKNLSGSSLLDTNMTTDGMLPTPQAFSCYGISCFVEQGIPEADMVNLINNGAIEFKMSNKPYLQAPFHQIPAAGGLAGFASTTANNTTIFQAQNGGTQPFCYLPLDIEGEAIHLVSQQDFSVVLTTHNSIAFTKTIYLTMHLVGVLYRPVL